MKSLSLLLAMCPEEKNIIDVMPLNQGTVGQLLGLLVQTYP